MFPKIYIGKRNEKHFFLTTNEIVLQEILKEEKREKEKEKEQEREGGENRSERNFQPSSFPSQFKMGGKKGEELERFPTKLRDPLRLVSGF